MSSYISLGLVSTLENLEWTEQEANKWPGLVEEVDKMCDTLNLEYPSKTSMSRKSYSEAVVGRGNDEKGNGENGEQEDENDGPPEP